MVLKTDKQLSFSSEIASTIGLEEAILLQVLTDVSNLSDEINIEVTTGIPLVLRNSNRSCNFGIKMILIEFFQTSLILAF